MPQQAVWNRDEVVELLKSKERRLDIQCPPLRAYLQPGLNVLDVGCGPGPVTLDVAAVVAPGEVMGLDFSAASIAEAQTAAAAIACSNVSFQVGNTYELDFAAATFDVVYSTNLFVWLQNPVQALMEQRRVTKRGGWVLTHLSDYGNITFYPTCPAFNEYLAALAHLRTLGDQEAHIDSHQARRAIELLTQAGLSELHVQGWVLTIHRASEDFADLYAGWRNLWLSLDSLLGPLNRKLMTTGLLQEQTLAAAQSELDAWYEHPYAFYTQTHFLAAGRA